MKIYTFFILAAFVAAACSASAQTPPPPQGYKLLWADEFDTDGPPSSKYWTYERGYQRNHELQWYQPENVTCSDGKLIIEARHEVKPCPWYREGSDDWTHQRKEITCTSGCVTTNRKVTFTYGRLEVRAKIPTPSGSWPAIWLLGTKYHWPSCGEIDVMEYYRIKKEPYILANACWGSNTPYKGNWDMVRIPFKDFTKKDRKWGDKFHVWTMDWTPEHIRIYIDGELINEVDLSKTINGTWQGEGVNPFHSPMYLLLNLAIEGDNGGKPDWKKFPLRYEIDYVRIYQRDENATPESAPAKNEGWKVAPDGEIHF